MDIKNNSHSGFPLYLAEFLVGIAFFAWYLAWPFVLKDLGATNTQIGNSFTIYCGLFMAACIVNRMALCHLNKTKLIVRGSMIAMAIIAIALLSIVFMINKGHNVPAPILLVGGLFASTGALMALFQPFITSWVSTGHEGKELSQRLGHFNAFRVAGALVGPVLCGYLVSQGAPVALSFPIIAIFIAFIAGCLSQHPSDVDESAKTDNSSTDDEISSRFRLKMCLMALLPYVTGWFCSGLIMSNMGILLRDTLGFEESVFGWFSSLMAVSGLAAVTLIGKVHQWHNKGMPLMAIQLTLILSFIMILSGTANTLLLFLGAALVFGVVRDSVYMVHTFYIVSGVKEKRSKRTILHEFIGAVALAVGPFIGGRLSDNFGAFTPYKCALGLAIAGLIAQILLWTLWRPAMNETPNNGVNTNQ